MSLGSHNASADQSPVLAGEDRALTLQLLATSRANKVLHLAFNTALDELVKVSTSLPPSTCHQTLQLSKGLQSRHKRAHFPWLSPKVLPVQSFKVAAVRVG